MSLCSYVYNFQSEYAAYSQVLRRPDIGHGSTRPHRENQGATRHAAAQGHEENAGQKVEVNPTRFPGDERTQLSCQFLIEHREHFHFLV